MRIQVMSRAALCVIACLSTACNDGLLHEAAPPGPGRVSLSALVVQGGTAEAYAQTNTLWLRFSEGEETRFENTVPFDAAAEEVRVGIQVPMRETTETFFLEIELRRDSDAVFQGSAEVELTGGQTAEVDIPLQPVVAGVSCAGPNVLLDAYGATAQLTAAALFATGDTVPSAGVAWSTESEAPVTVNTAGVVLAQYDGTAIVTCSAGGATDTRTVIVLATVTSVAVTPGQAAVLIGGTQTFTAIARDRLQNEITGRTTTWTSASPGVASVNQAGVAMGLAAGSARIDAAIDGVIGSGTLAVSFPPPGPPSVRTISAAYLPNSDAFLQMRGAVTPNGAATNFWFEWSPIDPTLSRANSTPLQRTDQALWDERPFEDGFFGQGTQVWVRAVAENQFGRVYGAIIRAEPYAGGRTVQPGLSGNERE